MTAAQSESGGPDIDEVLANPLMAHLATGSPDGPRRSPVWFYVDPGHRGRGYAAEAMGLIENEARSVFGVTELRLKWSRRTTPPRASMNDWATP